MELEDLAKRIRDACLDAVVGAYDDAGIQGLCAEGVGGSCRRSKDP